MPMVAEDNGISKARLVTSREPKVRVKAGEPGSVGDQALMDAVFMIGAAWLALFLLGFSLRGSNV